MPPEDSAANRIRRLKQRLYSRKSDPVVHRERRELHERDFGVAEEWEPDEIMPKKEKRISFVKILLIISVVFFVGSVGVSTWLFLGGENISHKNVVIEIEGPASIGGGEELGLQITIINRNPVAIDDVDLIIEYPAGTRAATNINVELPRYRESLGTILPGEEVRRSVRSILFGEEGSVKDINVAIEFRVEDSNAIFFNDTNYQLSLSTSPLSLVIETLKEAISGQEIEINVKITSNSKDVIKDVLLQIEYPFGFLFEEGSPNPIFANRLWKLGDIPPEEEKEITLRGTLSGQDGEERIFRFCTGIESEAEPNTLDTCFINSIESIFVKRPFITLDLALDGNDADIHVARGGRSVRGDIRLTNNLPTQLFNGEVKVKLSGDILNEFSIDVDKGFYDSITNTITWSKSTGASLGSIPAGKTNQVSFSFAPFGLSSGVPFRNPEIDLDVSIQANRISEDQVPEEILSTLSRKVRISTDLILSSKSLHFTGVLPNSGPVPPRAEQTTTYAIVWSVTNSSNQVRDAVVVASLPSFIEWGDLVSNPSEDISYNPVGGQVIWRLGDISPGTGSVTPAREIAFQVRLTPSLSQIDSVPNLVNDQRLTGIDEFVNRPLTSTRRPITIKTSDPASFNTGSIVVP